MKLTRSEFDARYKAGTLKLALIGMSNIGKSYSGMRLATHFDFILIEVDRLIWDVLGETDMDAFAAWQGQPYSEGYEERERESIALETVATRKSLETEARNPLLDTTGSVIYTDKDVLDALKRDWFVVYIEAADEHLERLKSQYFAQPKPLAWNGHYQKRDELSETESLLVSYPELLASRAWDYAALADYTISSKDILTPDHQALFDLVKPA
ncbi:MAG: shikimate kinase [Pseudomonadota bacterium]